MGQGLSLGSVATSTYDVIPAAGRGRLQALRRTVAELGGVSGPAMGGLIANAYNPGGAFLVVGPLLLFGGAAVGRSCQGDPGKAAGGGRLTCEIISCGVSPESGTEDA